MLDFNRLDKSLKLNEAALYTPNDNERYILEHGGTGTALDAIKEHYPHHDIYLDFEQHIIIMNR